MDAKQIFQRARAAEISGVSLSDGRFGLKQLHRLCDLAADVLSESSTASGTECVQSSINVNHDLPLIVDEISSHIQNWTAARKNSLVKNQSPWIDFRPVGLAVIHLSGNTRYSARQTFAILAAAFAAGNIVLIASERSDDALLGKMEICASRYLQHDSFFVVKGVPSMELSDFDVCASLSDGVLSFQGMPSASIGAIQKQIIHDGAQDRGMLVAAENADLKHLQAQLMLGSTASRYCIIFLHSSNVEAQSTFQFLGNQIIRIEDLPQDLSQGVSNARAGCIQLVLSYSNIIQVTQLLLNLRRPAWVHFHGSSSSPEGDYLRQCADSSSYSAGDRVPAFVPDHQEAALKREPIPTMYSSLLFSRPQLVWHTSTMPQICFEGHLGTAVTNLKAVRSLPVDGSGKRLGFFEQAVVGVGAAFIFIAAVFGTVVYVRAKAGDT